MSIAINIKKASVYDEVAKLTGYVGSKTVEDNIGQTYEENCSIISAMLHLSQVI